METTPYDVVSYIQQCNPKAITAIMRKYGKDPLQYAPTPTLMLQLVEENGQPMLMDLFEAYWRIVNSPEMANSVNGAFYPTLDGQKPDATPVTDKKSGWDKFSQVFGMITGGVGAATALINSVKAPKQTAQPAASVADDGKILGISKPAFFGIVIVIVVVVIAVVAKKKK
jgi:phosphotransferase system  glucose/maltose/N-acetylglucosamine-specific IIC component